jgi:capsular exopolysaccharide synthesis family protein
MRDADEASLSEILHLRDYWRTVRKRLWTVIVTFSLIVLSVTIVTLLKTPMYEATASLQIDAQPQANTNLNAFGQYGSGQYLSDQEYFATQHKKLRSRVQARAVMEALQLDQTDDFKDLEPDEAVEKLLNAVTIEPVPKTRLVWVFVRWKDPEVARQICQAWVDTFTERNMDEINEGVQDGLQWLKREVDKAEQDFRDAEANLLTFRRAHNQIALSSQEKGNLAMQQLEELSRKLALAEADRAERQAMYDSLASSAKGQKDLRRLSLLVDSDLMGKLREDYSTLQADRKALAETYLPQHPKMQEVDTRIADVETQIRGEVESELARRKALLEEAKTHEDELKAAIEKSTNEALSDDDEAEYNLLRREVDSRTTLYQTLVSRMQEMNVTSQLKENNVRVIDSAEADKDPVEPNYVRNIGIALLAGALAAVSLAIFFDYMDTTIKSREEVEALGIPFLGIIPSVPGLAGEGWEVARERYLYAMNYPKSAFAEFCRNIRTNINFTARDDGKPPTRILITSAGPREGKTTSSINLGITFASTGRRVCLVDADLRRPSLHHAFGLSNDYGFSSLINQTVSAEEVAQPTPQEGLYIIPSGPRPPNPAEVLGSPGCRAALARLNELFDLVIIDSPPVVAVTDAVVLSTEVDGVVMVVKSFKVAKDLILQAKRQLVDVDARLIGVILNDFDIQRKSYGYYYYYTYYGSDRDENARTRRVS